MDSVYQMKLESAATAPDNAFPELLFNPIKNDFNDSYFRVDYEDYGQEAVQVDSRFTRRNILRIKGAEKRIDVYLENVALYEDYMDYLRDKYGSVDIAYEMDEAGILKDVLPRFTHPPILKKGKLRRLFRQGIIPSFMPRGINELDVYEYMKEVFDKNPAAELVGEEPDIQWALAHKPGKAEREIILRNTERYRRQHRVELLNGGAAGVTSDMDFVDNYYANYERGAYDSPYTDRDELGTSLTAQMRAIEDRQYWHEGKIMEEEEKNSGSRFSYDGGMIRDREKQRRYELLKQIQEYTGIDIIGAMAGGGMSKKRIQAIRDGIEAVGGTVGLTEKERKKLRKKQAKMERQGSSYVRAEDKLAQVLLNNKIMMNGGTVRFEDMSKHRFDF